MRYGSASSIRATNCSTTRCFPAFQRRCSGATRTAHRHRDFHTGEDVVENHGEPPDPFGGARVCEVHRPLRARHEEPKRISEAGHQPDRLSRTGRFCGKRCRRPRRTSRAKQQLQDGRDYSWEQGEAKTRRCIFSTVSLRPRGRRWKRNERRGCLTTLVDIALSHRRKRDGCPDSL